MFGTKTIEFVDKDFKEKLKRELREQGHYLTGDLEESISSTTIIKEAGETIAKEVSAEDYIEGLETGIPKESINPGDSGYIAGLTRYAMLRFGVQGEAAKRIAFAIAAKHKKEGMPTKSSYAYSANGRRTKAIEQTEVLTAPKMDLHIETGISDELDKLFEMDKEVLI